MAYSIAWAESAIASVAEQVEYIARESPSYAATLVAKTEKAANSLFQFPIVAAWFPNMATRRYASCSSIAFA